MNDSEMLDLLDRRAAGAVDLLDRAVADVAVPPFDPTWTVRLDGRSPLWRRPGVLAMAAALLVVALVAAVAVSMRDDDSELPVATTGTHRHLVLPPELADDHATTVAVDAASSTATTPDISMRVLVPASAEPPWPDVVMEYVLPASDTTLDGDVVDIGGPEAFHDEDELVTSIGWAEGETVRYVGSATLGRDPLVALAAEIVAGEIEPGAPVPGWDLLFSGSYADVVPNVALLAGTHVEGSTIAYLDETQQEGLVVGSVAGGPERWRASYSMADDVTDVSVRGQDGVVARYASDLVEVSWIEGGDTLVRAWPIGPRPLDDAAVDGFLATLEQLVEVDDAEWARLVAEHPVPGDESSEGSIEGSGEPRRPLGDPELIDQWSEDAKVDPDHVAGTVVHHESVSARAIVRRVPDGGHVLVGEIQGRDGGAGQEQDLRSLSDPVAATMTDGANLFVYGLVEAGVDSVEVRSADGRALFSTGAAGGIEPNVFSLLVEGVTSLEEIGADRVVGIRGDGTEVVIPLA